MIGEEGEGFKLGQKWLGIGRLKHGGRAIGVARRAIEMGAAYAKQRVTFGRPLADRQAISFKLADSYTELHAATLMVYHAAWKYDQGRGHAQRRVHGQGVRRRDVLPGGGPGCCRSTAASG